MTRILIIEDNKTLANLIAKKIEIELTWQVDTAYSMQEAKLFLRGYDYFVTLCDLNLPDAPNGEIVDYLLEKEQKVIVLSGNIDTAFRKKMMQKNIIDYIKKSGAQDIRYIISMLKRLEANKNHTVMIVDDSMVGRNNLKKMTENLFFNVITVAHGEEALGMLQTKKDISLVLTDYNMPVMDGLTLTQEIRKEYNKNELAIIALSSSNDEEVIALFLKNGANDYIKKPFSKEELYCRVDNMIEMLENIQQILNSANRDFLTGLYNRRYFFNHIDQYIQEAQEGFSDLYIAMIDIDHFKSINDTYGHEEGDKAIELVADIMRTNTNQKDLVARFGGEEFCIALLADDLQTAVSVIERIRVAIETSEFVTKKGERIHITVSAGIAKYNEGDDINEVINAADANLYKAKTNGRNQVVY